MGICGPCVLAALLHLTVRQVLKAWPRATEREYPGYATYRELRKVAALWGVSFVQKPGKPWGYRYPQLSPDEAAIVKIEWRCPHTDDGRWRHWRDREGHYVAFVYDEAGQDWVYCDGVGVWVPPRDHRVYYYMTDGRMTSYLQVVEAEA